jgi:hypothetical protein
MSWMNFHTSIFSMKNMHNSLIDKIKLDGKNLQKGLWLKIGGISKQHTIRLHQKDKIENSQRMLGLLNCSEFFINIAHQFGRHGIRFYMVVQHLNKGFTTENICWIQLGLSMPRIGLLCHIKNEISLTCLLVFA